MNFVNGVKGVLGVALLGAALFVGAFDRSIPPQSTFVENAGVVALSSLPVQGQRVYQKILEGGPFQYEKDGTVFRNREGKLPQQQRGFYREYTVPTPKLSHRGARRIVCGGANVRVPDACYYTKDHYQSFNAIDAQR